MHVTWDYPCKEELITDKTRVDFPGVEVGACVLRSSELEVWISGRRGNTYDADVIPHSSKERNEVGG